MSDYSTVGQCVKCGWFVGVDDEYVFDTDLNLICEDCKSKGE